MRSPAFYRAALSATACLLMTALATGQTAPASADETGAMAALKAYADAVGAADVARVREQIHTTSDLQRGALDVMGRLVQASYDLYRATDAKFGAGAMASAGVTKASFPPVFPTVPLEGLRVKVDGDRATLSTESGAPIPLTLVRVRGAWKLNGDDFLPPFSAAQFAEQGKVVSAAIEAIEQTKADLATTALRSPDEVYYLMQYRVSKVSERASDTQMSESTTAPATRPVAGK
ncbi:MAG TPA: hypothetical protein VF624_05225 [Tepidisphaeraceae bacterium]|jgi:hypothetical protein